jgi:predicted Zn-dependent protease
VKNPGPEWLSTHPAPRNRVDHVEEQVRKNASYSALAADSAHTDYRSRFVQMTASVR